MQTHNRLAGVDRVVRILAYWRRRHFTSGVLVQVHDETDQILLVKQRWRQRSRWGFPGGFIRPGESFEAAALREVYEETSLRIRDVALLDAYIQPHARHVEVLVTGSYSCEPDETQSPSSRGNEGPTELQPVDRLEIRNAQWFPETPETLPALTIETAFAMKRLHANIWGLDHLRGLSND